MKRIIAAILLLVTFSAITMLLLETVPPGPANVAELTRRIKHLESVVAQLQKDRASAAKTIAPQIPHTLFTPDGKALTTPGEKAIRIWQLPQSSQTEPPQVIQTTPLAPGTNPPPGWQPREFNGLTYYVVPLRSR